MQFVDSTMRFPYVGLTRPRDSLVTSVCLATAAGAFAAVATTLISDLRARTLDALALARALLLTGRRRRRETDPSVRRRSCVKCCSHCRGLIVRGMEERILGLPKLYGREIDTSRDEHVRNRCAICRKDSHEETSFVYERVSYRFVNSASASGQMSQDVSDADKHYANRGICSKFRGNDPILGQRCPSEMSSEPVTLTSEGIQKVFTSPEGDQIEAQRKPKGLIPIVCEGLSTAFRFSVEPVTPEPTADDVCNANDDTDVKPPSWRSFSLTMSEEGEDEWQLYGELDDTCSCQTEKKFIADLEERLAQLGVHGRTTTASLENEALDDDSEGDFAQECINLYQTGFSDADQGNFQDFTVFEYCSLFYRGQKVTIDMYDEFIEWRNGLQATIST